MSPSSSRTTGDAELRAAVRDAMRGGDAEHARLLALRERHGRCPPGTSAVLASLGDAPAQLLNEVGPVAGSLRGLLADLDALADRGCRFADACAHLAVDMALQVRELKVAATVWRTERSRRSRTSRRTGPWPVPPVTWPALPVASGWELVLELTIDLFDDDQDDQVKQTAAIIARLRSVVEQAAYGEMPTELAAWLGYVVARSAAEEVHRAREAAFRLWSDARARSLVAPVRQPRPSRPDRSMQQRRRRAR